jgi:hypothetical protein
VSIVPTLYDLACIHSAERSYTRNIPRLLDPIIYSVPSPSSHSLPSVAASPSSAEWHLPLNLHALSQRRVASRRPLADDVGVGDERVFTWPSVVVSGDRTVFGCHASIIVFVARHRRHLSTKAPPGVLAASSCNLAMVYFRPVNNCALVKVTAYRVHDPSPRAWLRSHDRDISSIAYHSHDGQGTANRPNPRLEEDGNVSLQSSWRFNSTAESSRCKFERRKFLGWITFDWFDVSQYL